MNGKFFKYYKDSKLYQVVGIAYDIEIDNMVVVFKAAYNNPEFELFTMSASNFNTRFEEVPFNPLT